MKERDQGLTFPDAVRIALQRDCRIRRYENQSFVLNQGWIQLPKQLLHYMPPITLEDFQATDWCLEAVRRPRPKNLFGR
jgi:hypothetical protein